MFAAKFTTVNINKINNQTNQFVGIYGLKFHLWVLKFYQIWGSSRIHDPKGNIWTRRAMFDLREAQT